MNKVLFISSMGIEHVERLMKRLSNANQGKLEIHFFDTRLNPIGVGLDDVKPHFIKMPPLLRRMAMTPRLGVLFRILYEYRALNSLMRSERFNVVSILYIPMEAFLYVKCAHRYQSKTLLVPLGSDVLRIGRFTKKLMSIAFKDSDYVSADKRYRFSRDLMSMFTIPDGKCRGLSFGSDALSHISELKGKYSKEYMQEQLGLPNSSFNIVCGYNATKGQRHVEMIRALIQNKNLLPKDYLVIIPLTYGTQGEDIRRDISGLAGIDEMRIAFLTDFMDAEHVAFLRLITDLFIHIQTTDGYNASLQEFILAGAQCVNGSWLVYDTLEKYGVPYHKLDTVNNLPCLINDFFSSRLPSLIVPNECIEEIRKGKDWEVVLPEWVAFLNQNFDRLTT